MKSLSSKQVEQLLIQYGFNAIKEQKKTPILIKFLEQFNNFLTILLLAAAVFSFFIGEPVDGTLIIAIVILNAFFGLYQEAKAEESIAALRTMTVTKVRVIRDGKQQEVDSRYLVPGDLIFIEEGTKIPADGLVVEGRNLELNEAALTGESLPVGKREGEAVFSGTIVARGRGLMEATYTGMQSKLGQIAQNLSIIEEGATPLQKKLADLTRLIGIVGIFLAVVVFTLSFLEGSGYFPAFLLAISLAVAVVPEGLPAVMTITLAIGVGVMAGKKAIIRRLSAIEALGSITLIATDKTGTLTTNKMKVKEVLVDGKVYESNNLPSLINHPFNLLVLNGILCSTASLSYVEASSRPAFPADSAGSAGKWDVLGDPTEGALLYLAQEADLVPEIIRKEWQIIDEKPFDSVTKMMTVVVKHPRGGAITFSKGAPESILSVSNKILIGKKEEKMSDRQKGEIEKQVEKWARKGLRVLAFSYSTLDTGSLKLDKEAGSLKLENPVSSIKRQNLASSFQHQASNQVFLGLVAIHDAPRPEVVEAVKKAKEAGIKVVMITGDNEKTAEAVAVLTGIINDGEEILTGEQINDYSDEELAQILKRVKVMARTNPFQKYRIVKIYQELGEIVAVTGDGVNDALALKQADCGVAMGLIGTDVARETADMVITDDNFATIVGAVEEGRNIIKNLKNAIKYLLSANLSEAASLVVGLFLGLPALFYPIQLLYINLVTDGIPALVLSFSPRHPNLMRQPPERSLTILKSFDKKYIALVGLMASLIVLASSYLYKDLGKTAVFSVLTLIQSFIFIDLWLSHQSLRKSLTHLKSPFFILAFIIPFILQYFIVRFAVVASLFKITPVSFFIYLQFVVISSLILLGIKGIKSLLKIS